MPYPTTPTANYYRADGAATTLIWGTDNILPAAWGAYVCLRFNQRVKKEDIPITNGTGVESGRIQISHGNVWEITVRDDGAITPPLYGAQVIIKDAAGHLGANTATYNARVIDSGVSTGPKQAMERTLTVERLHLVD